jgi:UDP-N-acetylglucosamine 2-epimerase (non-hydrolysing)
VIFCLLLQDITTQESVFVTGNTIVDALNQNLEVSKHKFETLGKFGLRQNDYFLVTLHRAENVNSLVRFKNIITALESLPERFNCPVIYPIHPPSRKMLHVFKITPRNIIFAGPLDYFSFLQLEKNAKLILTDSGGGMHIEYTLCHSTRQH